MVRKNRDRAECLLRRWFDLINVVTGNARAIDGEFISSTIVCKLTFMGSTGINCLLMEQSVLSIKKLSLALGGNAPFIVFDDGDL